MVIGHSQQIQDQGSNQIYHVTYKIDLHCNSLSNPNWGMHPSLPIPEIEGKAQTSARSTNLISGQQASVWGPLFARSNHGTKGQLEGVIYYYTSNGKFGR